MLTIYAYLGLLALLFTLFGYFLHAFAYRNSSVRRLSDEVEHLRTIALGSHNLESAKEAGSRVEQLLRTMEQRWESLKREIDLLADRLVLVEQRSAETPLAAAPAEGPKRADQRIPQEALEDILRSLDRIEEELGRLPQPPRDEVTSQP